MMVSMRDKIPGMVFSSIVALTLFGVLWSIYLIFVGTGIERQLGFSQKIFYFHVPSAWVTYLAFTVTGICSIAFLFRRRAWLDDLAHASLEVGTVFTTLVLVTGPLWAKPAWGAYWVWDARLTTTLVLWLIEVSYLMLRSFMDDRRKAAVSSAVLAVLGLVDIPLIHQSVVLWRGMHPDPVVARREGFGSGLPPEFLFALMVSLATFTLLFVALTWVRYSIARMQDRIEALKLISEEKHEFSFQNESVAEKGDNS